MTNTVEHLSDFLLQVDTLPTLINNKYAFYLEAVNLSSVTAKQLIWNEVSSFNTV